MFVVECGVITLIIKYLRGGGLSKNSPSASDAVGRRTKRRIFYREATRPSLPRDDKSTIRAYGQRESGGEHSYKIIYNEFSRPS